MRINITVDRETLRSADREARRQKTSRSEFIRKAVRDQAENRRREFGEEEKRNRQTRAIEGMNRLAKQFHEVRRPVNRLLFATWNSGLTLE